MDLLLDSSLLFLQSVFNLLHLYHLLESFTFGVKPWVNCLKLLSCHLVEHLFDFYEVFCLTLFERLDLEKRLLIIIYNGHRLSGVRYYSLQ